MTIAIVGAGLGGLALARVLHMNGIDAVVYERESSRRARGQGGMLDLHAETGQQALREAGLIEVAYKRGTFAFYRLVPEAVEALAFALGIWLFEPRLAGSGLQNER